MLEKITSYISSHKLSKKIQERLKKDLEVIYQRLSSGQYEYHDYSQKNIFCVDERTQDFFLYLKSYAESGRVWEQIFKNINIGQYQSVIDLCSGHSPKITLGLYYIGYTGEMMLVDKTQKCLDDLESFMNEVFRPDYKIIKNCSEIQGLEGKDYGCVIANHVFDDLLLDMYCRSHNLSTDSLYTDELYLRDIWRKIENDTLFLEEISEKLANIFDDFIVQQGVVCFSQYESMMEGILKLNVSVEISIEVMQKTISLLKQKGYIDISNIALSGLDTESGTYYILKK